MGMITRAIGRWYRSQMKERAPIQRFGPGEPIRPRKPDSLLRQMHCITLHRRHYRPYIIVGHIKIYWCMKCDRAR